MNWFDNIMARKAPIGFVLTVIAAGMVTSANTTILAWGAALAASGAVLVGGGIFKSDQYYKEKVEDKKIAEEIKKTIE